MLSRAICLKIGWQKWLAVRTYHQIVNCWIICLLMFSALCSKRRFQGFIINDSMDSYVRHWFQKKHHSRNCAIICQAQLQRCHFIISLPLQEDKLVVMVLLPWTVTLVTNGWNWDGIARHPFKSVLQKHPIYHEFYSWKHVVWFF